MLSLTIAKLSRPPFRAVTPKRSGIEPAHPVEAGVGVAMVLNVARVAHEAYRAIAHVGHTLLDASTFVGTRVHLTWTQLWK